MAGIFQDKAREGIEGMRTGKSWIWPGSALPWLPSHPGGHDIAIVVLYLCIKIISVIDFKATSPPSMDDYTRLDGRQRDFKFFC